MNMKKYLQLIFLGMILTLLVACATPGAVEGALIRRANNQVNEGMSRNSTLVIMGTPRKTESFENLTLDAFCTTGGYDDMVEIIYENERVVDVSTYTSRRVGQCQSFFRVRSLSAFKVQLEEGRQKAAEEARAALIKSQIKSQDYFIDGLVIIHTQDSGAECASGSEYKIEVRGVIGPDSSFALEELLRRSPNCIQENGDIKSRTIIELESFGGRLEDGYLMGRTFRSHEVETIITNNSTCASSCAVAYLGGVERLMESDAIIMFHSPYLPDLNAQGDRIANCDIGSEMTTRLLEYYQEMTSPEQGERLMNRTMSYCSAEDGWVLRGSAAAELFGVATEI
jgi:ATP-dependent protease ClpP protease subunit